MKRLPSLLVVLVLLGCGGGDSPSTPTPSIVNAAGLWTGTSRLDTVSGGDCVGATMAAMVGTTGNITVQITQNGSALTAVSTATATGDTTNYSGTAGASSISLDWTQMSAGIITGFRCSNGERRDMEVRTNAVTATISGNTQTGTQAESWNIKVNGTGQAVGILFLNSSFTLRR